VAAMANARNICFGTEQPPRGPTVRSGMLLMGF
jgi:hypothetical protein